jgi:hypothetical protein
LIIYAPKINFQNHPFHLVSPSPWPIYTSIALFNLTTSAVLFMHGFQNYENLVFLGLFNLVYSMSLWFRDVISEGIKSLKRIFKYLFLKIASAISIEIIQEIKNDCKDKFKLKDDQFGFYLAGLFEGAGHLSLPFIGQTTLNRVLNPRIVFISHINNLDLYVYIQNMLGGKGRFQKVNNNVIRYVIGDIEGIKLFIHTIHGKLRTPKNESFNKLIQFINQKYNLLIPFSSLDKSELLKNSWFVGFTEADGYFGVKIIEVKSKPDTRKRSVSNSISLKFRLDQRYLDSPSLISMLEIMEILSIFLNCKLTTYETKTGKFLSLSVSAIEKIGFIIDYFNRYSLQGTKKLDFKDWEIIYNMMINKEHLTNVGREKIKLIQSNMNSNRKINIKYIV